MRRTSERGWIAKAYPDAHRTTSQSELDITDDLSDCDSFFDDDFDTETQNDKLGLLLSCNTLGVESKVRGSCRHCVYEYHYQTGQEPCPRQIIHCKQQTLLLYRVDAQTGLQGKWTSQNFTAQDAGTTGMVSQTFHAMRSWPG